MEKKEEEKKLSSRGSDETGLRLVQCLLLRLKWII
jgi:hypothetical protein